MREGKPDGSRYDAVGCALFALESAEEETLKRVGKLAGGPCLSLRSAGGENDGEHYRNKNAEVINAPA